MFRSKTDTSSQAPWLENKHWRNNRLVSNAKTTLALFWGIAVVWNAVCFAILFELFKGQQNKEIGSVFFLIGLILFIIAIHRTLRWRRFGVIELRLDPFPGSIGGHVGGTLLMTRLVDLNASYQISLECVYSYQVSDGEKSSRRENVLWSEQGVAKINPVSNGMQLLFRFNVPENLPEADVKPGKAYYLWRLRLHSVVNGIPLNRSYHIPVFKTAESSAQIRHDLSAQAEKQRKHQNELDQSAIQRRDFAHTALARSMRYEQQGRTQTFYFPMFRNPFWIFFIGLFAVGFDFAFIALNQTLFTNGSMDWPMFLFSLPFGLVGLAATLAGIILPLSSLTTTIENRTLSVTRRWLFIPYFKRIVQADEIVDIILKSSGSTSQGRKTIEHFRLAVITCTQQEFVLAEGIDGRDLAEQFREFIARQLALKLKTQAIAKNDS